MSEITPEKVAAVLGKGVAGWRWDLESTLSVTAEGNVLSLELTSWGEGPEYAENICHFRAVVVEGETEPIVLERPDLTDLFVFEGGSFHNDDDTGWQVVPYSSTAKWPGDLGDADSILYRTDGDPSNKSAGHISFAEARRFAAALVAVADVAEASQAVQNGGAK